MTDQSTRVTCRGIAIALLGSLTLLLAAGCGGSSHAREPKSSHSASSQMLAYSACMRAHGEPKFPDPNAQGQVKQQLRASGIDVSSPRFQAADVACRSKLPNGGSSAMTPAQLQQMKAVALKFSRCIRAHGFPNYPDPGSDGREPDPTSVGINDQSAKYKAADKACFQP
jgi:hypothetical protein